MRAIYTPPTIIHIASIEKKGQATNINTSDRTPLAAAFAHKIASVKNQNTLLTRPSGMISAAATKQTTAVTETTGQQKIADAPQAPRSNLSSFLNKSEKINAQFIENGKKPVAGKARDLTGCKILPPSHALNKAVEKAAGGIEAVKKLHDTIVKHSAEKQIKLKTERPAAQEMPRVIRPQLEPSKTITPSLIPTPVIAPFNAGEAPPPPPLPSNAMLNAVAQANAPKVETSNPQASGQDLFAKNRCNVAKNTAQQNKPFDAILKEMAKVQLKATGLKNS
ncbi:hypothetical protein QMX33_002767 [Yersinia ruckeri]|nr:hypothetical protein [Yersinia ruckeri]EKN4202904.1 hypothetical protein [Yersinia ruckeri]EKN4727324.1 hypothetical protein [Yersinia ruckeri]ELV7521580.1 hypothetical protein [Yersinia ruckeri]